MIVYNQKETEKQPPNWLDVTELVVYGLLLLIGCVCLWKIIMMIGRRGMENIVTYGDLLYFVVYCVTFNTVLFYLGILLIQRGNENQWFDDKY